MTHTDFDRVVLDDPRLGRAQLSLEEFLALPVSERIRCVIQRTIRFYMGSREVDRHAALNSLRRARSAT